MAVFRVERNRGYMKSSSISGKASLSASAVLSEMRPPLYREFASEKLFSLIASKIFLAVESLTAMPSTSF